MNQRIFRATLAAALVAAAPFTARADVLASVELEDFGYRLIDLRPGDGIAPALAFDPRVMRAGVAVAVGGGQVPDQPPPVPEPPATVVSSRTWARTEVFFPEAAVGVDTPLGHASAALFGSLADGSYGARVEGRALNRRDDPLLATGFSAGAEPVWTHKSPAQIALTLSPFTEVVWQGAVRLESRTTLGGRGGGRSELAQAGVDFVLHNPFLADPLARFSDLVTADGYRPAHAAESHGFELRWANATAAPANGYLTMEVSAYGQSFQPVPEPDAPWLGLGGAALLAGVLRRRRARGAAPAAGAGASWRRGLRPGAAAGVLALCATPGWALVSAEVEVTRFGYRLVDLRPGDGIAPRLQLSALPARGPGGSELAVSFLLASPGLIPGEPFERSAEDRRSDGFTAFPTQSAAWFEPEVDVQGWMSGVPRRRDVAFGGRGELRLDGGDAAQRAGSQFRAMAAPVLALGVPGNGVSAFSLTPFTRVVWTGQLSMRLRLAGEVAPGHVQNAFGAVFLELNSADQRQQQRIVVNRDLTRTGPARLELGRGLRLSMDNATGALAIGYLSALSDVGGSLGVAPSLQAAAPVPEPASWALLLLGGAGVAGTAALRRRRSGGHTPCTPSIFQRYGARARSTKSTGSKRLIAAGASAPLMLLAAMLAVAGLPAQAEVTASARMERFGYRLIDLNPGDGIAPGIELATGPGAGVGGSAATAFTDAQDTRPPPLGLRGQDGDSAIDNHRMFVPSAVQAASPGLSAWAEISGSPHRHDVRFEAFGRMDIGPDDARARRETRFGATASPAVQFSDTASAINSFRVTPFTQVIWSGHVELHVRMDATVRGAPAATGAVAELSLRDAEGRVIDAFRRIPGVVGSVPDQRDYVARAAVSFSNASAAPAVAYLGTQVYVESRMLPVPEAGSAALLLCGLGAVGLTVRRARRGPTPPG